MNICLIVIEIAVPFTHFLIFAGGAADRAGIEAGDYILEINGLSVRYGGMCVGVVCGVCGGCM